MFIVRIELTFVKTKLYLIKFLAILGCELKVLLNNYQLEEFHIDQDQEKFLQIYTRVQPISCVIIL